MISPENISTGDIIDELDAFECQFDKESENFLFKAFNSTNLGDEMKTFKNDILEEVNLNEERGAVSISMLEEKIGEKEGYTTTSSDSDKTAFVYKLYNEHIDITITALPAEEDYFTILIEDKVNKETGRYQVEDNKNKIIDIIIHLYNHHR